MATPLIPLATFVINLVYTHMSNLTASNSNEYKCFWESKLSKKADRKTLSAFMTAGTYLNKHGMYSDALGFKLSDDIVQNTVNILCLGIVG